MTTILTRRVLPKEAATVRAELRTLANTVRQNGTIGLGDTGPAVKALQEHLFATGLYTGAVSGNFDAATETALKQFQQAKKLTVTGRVDRSSYLQLTKVNSYVKDGFQTVAREGQRGTDILSAERHLAKLGFLKGTKADGVYDGATAKAVSWYRKADKELGDEPKAIGAGFYSELKKASASWNHDPRRTRVMSTDAQAKRHRAVDDLTAKAAGAKGGMKLGDKSRAVQNVQHHLEAAGYELGSQSGTYGRRTEAAVRTFQRRVKLPETGVVDAKTWKALRDGAFAATTATSPAQKLGESSAQVKKTEMMLKTLGHKDVRVDGHFNAEMKAAVQRFQKKNGLEATGEVNGKTLKKIEQAYQKKVGVHKPPVIWKPSPNYGSRYGTDIDSIIMHHTASNSTASDLATLRSSAAQVSAHYLIGRDGKIYQLVKDGMRAWHAGVAAIRGDGRDVNSRSIGIEITNAGDGRTPFTAGQYKALEQLVPWLMKTYKIPMKNLLGHKQVALPKGRKTDPANNFDFDRIRRAARNAGVN